MVNHKEDFIRLLRSTRSLVNPNEGRQGMEKVISWLEESGFFKAPASTVFHGNMEGGLMEHSYQVAIIANDLREVFIKRKPELENRITRESVIIAALLHDVCKADIYVKETKYRKNEHGGWDTYEAYNADYSKTDIPLGHGEKSVIRLLRLGLEMTEDEMMAIRWHMGAWNMPMQDWEAKSNLNAARDKSPLVSILLAADDLTSHVIGV